MDRRSFLATFGAVALAGCSESQPTPTPGVQTVVVTPSPTESPTASPTSFPTPEVDPSIEAVNLVSDWKEFGDVIENRIESITPDEPAIIGVRVTLVCGEDREVRWRNVTTVVDESGDTVASDSTTNQEFSNVCADYRTNQWEQALTLNYDNSFSASWPPGTYRATVRIDDYPSAETVSQAVQFEVTET